MKTIEQRNAIKKHRQMTLNRMRQAQREEKRNSNLLVSFGSLRRAQREEKRNELLMEHILYGSFNIILVLISILCAYAELFSVDFCFMISASIAMVYFITVIIDHYRNEYL